VLARQLVRRFVNGVLLDKDRVLGAWVDRVLRAVGEDVDGDGAYYWLQVRPQEYVTFETVDYDHVELGKLVVLDAPLRPELENPAWVARVNGECRTRGGGLLAVWLVVPPEMARQRMQARGEQRDRWTLTHWEDFLRRQPYAPPANASLVLRNDANDAEKALFDRICLGGAHKE
jgi:hypothetical protein